MLINVFKKISRLVVRMGSDSVKRDPLLMPLLAPVYSNEIGADFLCGENIQIMNGSVVTLDSRIGANTYIGFNCHVTRATIGRYVSIANSVVIGPGEHCLSEISTSSVFYDNPYSILTSGNCDIEDDVWIGADSIIRRGVKIGFGAVVGANSFVNEDVPPFAIVAGTPARFIRSRFEPAVQECILKSQWTKLPIDAARDFLAELKVKVGI